MKVNLEPSRGNHNEEYLKIWYQEIEELSCKLAKHTTIIATKLSSKQATI